MWVVLVILNGNKMHVNQQQSSNGTINRVVQLLQSGTFKQKNLSDKISHEEINRLVNDYKFK
ncbi:hypothetical protein wNi1_13140 [Wolbachia pipientis]